MLSEPLPGKRSGEYSKPGSGRNRFLHFFCAPIFVPLHRAPAGCKKRVTPGLKKVI